MLAPQGHCVLTAVILLSIWMHFTPTGAEENVTSSAFLEDGLVYKVVQVNAGRRVNSYASYKDVVLTEFVVPPFTQSAIFGFSSQSTPKGCSDDKTIAAFIQHGGFPLFLLKNETWADNVFGNRSDFAYFDFPATDTTWKITVPAPREGYWFSAVFVKEVQEHMKQTGLFAKCDITYFASFLVSKFPDPIVELEAARTLAFQQNNNRSQRQLFRLCLQGDYYDSVEVVIKCDKQSRCPLQISARSDGIPSGNVTSFMHRKECGTTVCKLKYPPIQKKCQYILTEFGKNEAAEFLITVTPVSCSGPLVSIKEWLQQSLLPSASVNTSRVLGSGNFSSGQMVNDTFYQVSAEQLQVPLEQPHCPYVRDMPRLEYMPAFSSSFGVTNFAMPNSEYIFVPRSVFSDTVLRFEIEPYRDTGGTLHVALNLTDNEMEDLENLTIVACLHLGTNSRFDIVKTCQGPLLIVNATHLYSEVLIPYPEVGTWHLNIQGRPLVTIESNIVEYLPVELTVKTDQCNQGSCGLHGNCRVSLSSGVLITSACVCTAGWQGWDCTDSSTADTTTDLLLSLFFLTISNVFFIPATVVAVRRRYVTESVVYGATCFFSSFYHACDQPSKYLKLCIMDFNVLQFCDFYVSILSFWMTIVAMADLPPQLKSVCHMVGCIGIALGVEYEKTGLWVFAVPALTAVIILAVSWGFRSYRMKKIAPQKMYWLRHFLPGFAFAALGLILFAFVETKTNYKFVHSVWHIAMAMAVICFLPPLHHRSHGKYPKFRIISTDSDLSVSTGSGSSQDFLRPAQGEVVA
ncbi:post-GPI attachment to proteins factor 6-like [Paramacrobiotus metropolitanus]|uniref:post-GPI attachment to proteins factor 6-like n=1 Tax=Paramacrobiotus metropolitanus TaxID=2943436 RepID=UPI0024463753|nr:post-GPI attachment to proteins factor 6-like [Paramacrobiotus metropolitanus]